VERHGKKGGRFEITGGLLGGEGKDVTEGRVKFGVRKKRIEKKHIQTFHSQLV